MELLERRLLNVLEGLSPTDTQRRRNLEENLTNVRRERAVIELRLSADQKGATITPVPVAQTPLTQVCHGLARAGSECERHDRPMAYPTCLLARGGPDGRVRLDASVEGVPSRCQRGIAGV
jgi:hypothetical protein